jgi:nanoRNase/pAp phosphatase (c-di-AMP/oligoRNAs hydrolase)
MVNTKKYFIFTDCDLDGAGCYLTWYWFTGVKPDRISVRVNDFESKYKQWLAKGNLDKYDRVFVMDLDVSRIDCFDLLDNEKVTVIDHHQAHLDSIERYKNAKTIIQKSPSCTKIVYNMFKKSGLDLDLEKRLLLAMIDDYDSYKLKIPFSYHLNLLFWNYQGDRLEKFCREFKDGYTSFTSDQQKIIKFYLRKLENIKKDLDVHDATCEVNGQRYKFVSVFANQCINEVADHIIKNYKADIGFVINLNSGKVSLRRAKDCKIKLGKFAERLFDVGGGHDESAGGIICDSFLKFSKIFEPMKIKIGSE